MEYEDESQTSENRTCCIQEILDYIDTNYELSEDRESIKHIIEEEILSSKFDLLFVGTVTDDQKNFLIKCLLMLSRGSVETFKSYFPIYDPNAIEEAAKEEFGEDDILRAFGWEPCVAMVEEMMEGYSTPVFQLCVTMEDDDDAGPASNQTGYNKNQTKTCQAHVKSYFDEKVSDCLSCQLDPCDPNKGFLVDCTENDLVFNILQICGDDVRTVYEHGGGYGSSYGSNYNHYSHSSSGYHHQNSTTIRIPLFLILLPIIGLLKLIACIANCGRSQRGYNRIV